MADPYMPTNGTTNITNGSRQQCVNKCLHPNVVKALDKPPRTFAEEYTFSARQQPYQHQLEAWKALIEAKPARSVLVTNGVSFIRNK